MRPFDSGASDGCRLILPCPLGDDLERTGQEALAAGMALNFPARRLGQAQHLDQPDRVDVDVVLLGDRAADRRDDLVDHRLIAIPLDLLDDRQPLLPVDLDGEGRGAAGAERRVAPLRRPLDVLRIDVPAAEDDQVLEPAGDEELAILEEAQVARPEERTFAVRGASRGGVPPSPRSPPVAECDARTRDPDLADAILGARDAGRGIDDDDAMAGGDLTAADQLLGRGGWRLPRRPRRARGPRRRPRGRRAS